MDLLIDPQPPAVSPLSDIHLLAARHGVERERQVVSGELDRIRYLICGAEWRCRGRMCLLSKPFPKEFRDDVVRIARDGVPGKKIVQIARDFGVVSDELDAPRRY